MTGGEHRPSVRYLLRTVRIGVSTTALVLLALVVFPLLPGHQPVAMGPYVALLVAAAIGAIGVRLAPWRRLFDRGRGRPALYLWSLFDVGLISGAVAATGKGASELWILYGLTTVFFAASYPPRGQVALLAATVAAYLSTLGIAGLHATIAQLFLRTSILAVLALLAGFLCRELMREMDRQAAVRRETERMARLLVRLLSRLVDAQEDERMRVGRELHDELGQLLTSILHFSRRLEHDLLGEDAERAGQIVRVAERALAGTRSLVRALRPVELDHLGLVSAVRRLAYDIEDRHDLHVAVRAEGLEERLPRDLETAAYRVIQEALMNVVHHAGATAVDISLSRRGNEFVAAVQDDGGGFDPVAVSRAGEAGGVGLIGMLERARLVDGEVRIESAPGAGTLVRMRSPVARRAQPGETATDPHAPPASGIA
jgi:signal transduction histidine kinase